MHRYFKKLSSESSSFPSDNSPLNQEIGEHNTQTQAPNFDATTNPSSFTRSQVDLRVSTDDIMYCFQDMKACRGQLPELC